MTQDAILNSDVPLDASEISETAARNRLVIGLLLVSAFVVILNETIMSVALPRLMVSLGVDAGAAQWVTTAFLLTMAVVIPITGFLLQVLHTRPVFILAMTLFSVGTLVCASAPGLEVLVLGRVVQACGTAVMMPLLMTTVMNLVPPETRGRTMGNISIVISVAPAIGPTISGVILSVLDWRWMFLLVLPIGLAALAIGAARIKNVTTPRPAPLDFLSIILSALGFGGLVYGLSALGEGHAGAVPSWLPLVIGAIALGAFIWRQLALQKTDRALLDLRTFRSKTFSVSLIMMAISMICLFGTIILLPIYMQTVLGLTTLQSGLLLLPGGLIMGVLAPPVGRLYDRFGPKPLLIPGAIVVSAVLWLMTMVDQTTWFGWLLAGHVVISVGLALLFTPLFTASLSAVPQQLYSHGSAILGTIQQVAGAAGVALFVALMTMRTTVLMAAGSSQVEAVSEGIRVAFLCGAIISLFAIVAAVFVRKPEESGGAPMVHH